MLLYRQRLRTRLGWLKIYHHFLHTNILTSYFIIKDFPCCLYIWSNSQKPAMLRPKRHSLSDRLFVAITNMHCSLYQSLVESCGWTVYSAGISGHLSFHRSHGDPSAERKSTMETEARFYSLISLYRHLLGKACCTEPQYVMDRCINSKSTLE